MLGSGLVLLLNAIVYGVLLRHTALGQHPLFRFFPSLIRVVGALGVVAITIGLFAFVTWR